MRCPAVLALCATAGCTSTALPDPPEEPAVSEVRRVWYPGREQLKKRYGVLVHANGRVVKHGEETEFFTSGEVRAEREFRHGEPAGTWRTWHPGGAQRSQVAIGSGTDLLPMTWWYADGTLQADGEGRAGVREGPWTYRHPDGTLAERGPFQRGLRHGRWTLWYPTGKKQAEGAYHEGKRVGEWKLWNEAGKLTLKTGDPAPDEAPDQP